MGDFFPTTGSSFGDIGLRVAGGMTPKLVNAIYPMEALTQFHLKEWDEADNDLMLCYKTDDNTEFVLGCMYAE